MKAPFREIPGSIIAPHGFRAAGVFCDIKRLGTGKGSNKGNKRDLAVIVSDARASAAGMFTTNQVCAAPVKLCLERIRSGKAQAIVVNSGNANACTGKQGLKDARAMSDLVATKLKLGHGSVLVSSTGRIGVTLPMQNVRCGIADAIAILGSSPEHGAQVAEAIMTSDTHPKQIAVEFSLDGKRTRIGGVCKGAGMIQPGMSVSGKRPAALHATMLCFITTDAAIAPAALQLSLEQAVAQSFNRITVDGDMSTNDTVLILANGRAGNAARGKPALQSALIHVTLALANMIVRDGEGASRFVTVRVTRAESVSDADAVARAIANSSLVKTSWCGGDPNWGRILAALGYSRANIIEEKIDVSYSLPGDSKRLFALRKGQPTNTPFTDLCRIVAQNEFELHINLNLGKGAAVMYASDLTEHYVDFNKGDVSDPASMGG